jgi:hypothetical protein
MGMFAIILAIGSGWAFLKPFLSDREKRIFAIIIPLQILDNIALIVIEENMEGAAGYESWVRRAFCQPLTPYQVLTGSSPM